MKHRRVAVVAIGGNSLIRDNSHVTVEDQGEALRQTAKQLADMVAEGWDLAEARQGRAVITDPASMGRALRGEAGTVFLP